MLRNPTVHRADLTVGEAREAFEASAKRHLLLLVEHGRLVTTVSRDDLARARDASQPAVEVGSLDGRTLAPDVPLDEAMAQMERRGLRRLAVVEADRRLVGLLCLKRSLRGFCTDEGVAERRRERAAGPPALPPLEAQAATLVELGVHETAGLSEEAVRAAADAAACEVGDGNALLVFRPALAPASALTPLLRRGAKAGFVVEDMTDVDRFEPTGVDLPESPLYVVRGLERGDDMADWSPEEALPALRQRDRTPLLLTEGIHWALQQPEVLERNHCFMTIASRLVKPNGGFDARTPALWISNGTGRDGRARKDAPKVGWCWWRNRHTWLGIASAADRVG